MAAPVRRVAGDAFAPAGEDHEPMLYAPRDGGMWDTWMCRHDGTFHLYYLQSEGETTWPKIGHATSPDMIRWTEQEPALRAGTGGDWDVGPLGTGMVFPFGGRFYLNYCALGEGARQIGMAESLEYLPVKSLIPPIENLGVARSHDVCLDVRALQFMPGPSYPPRRHVSPPDALDYLAILVHQRNHRVLEPQPVR